MTNIDENTNFGTALQAVRDGFKVLNDNIGEVGQLIEEGEPGGNGLGYALRPEVVGQILMTVLPVSGTGHRLEMDDKTYWLQVANHIGPDWIAELRRVAAFMDKVDQF